MMSDGTKDMLMRIASMDPGATESELRSIQSFLNGGRERSCPAVRVSDAARRLGVHRNTILRMISIGRLKRVMGSGRRGVGVSAESLEDVLSGGSGNQ